MAKALYLSPSLTSFKTKCPCGFLFQSPDKITIHDFQAHSTFSLLRNFLPQIMPLVRYKYFLACALSTVLCCVLMKIGYLFHHFEATFIWQLFSIFASVCLGIMTISAFICKCLCEMTNNGI